MQELQLKQNQELREAFDTIGNRPLAAPGTVLRGNSKKNAEAKRDADLLAAINEIEAKFLVPITTLKGEIKALDIQIADQEEERKKEGRN